MLTWKSFHYDVGGLAPNAITYYKMLIASNEYLNYPYSINEHPRTVGLIASFIIMPQNDVGLAPIVLTYHEMLLVYYRSASGAAEVVPIGSL